MGRKKTNKSIMVLCVSSIIFMGAMGVGYSAWRDGITVDMSLATGYIDADIEAIEGRIPIDNGDFLELIVDGKDLKINGHVYPEFSYNLSFSIVDNGSIPIIVNGIEEMNKVEIALLKTAENYKKDSSKNAAEVYEQWKTRNPFNLEINPAMIFMQNNYYNKKMVPMETIQLFKGTEDYINVLRDQIAELKFEIEEYSQIDEEYNFEYSILCEQGL